MVEEEEGVDDQREKAAAEVIIGTIAKAAARAILEIFFSRKEDSQQLIKETYIMPTESFKQGREEGRSNGKWRNSARDGTTPYLKF